MATAGSSGAIGRSPELISIRICPKLYHSIAPCRERTIFSLIQDVRSRKHRLWCLAAGIAVNVTLIAALQVAAEIYSLRHASDRLLQIGKDLKTILIIPPPIPDLPDPSRTASTGLRPLETPDPRLLDTLNPRIVEFVRDNPAIEAIFTREIVRDFDRKVLNPERLLRRTHLEVSFDLTDEGHVVGERIVRSTRVPSLDHLALEFVRLLPEYLETGFLRSLVRITATLRIAERIEISFRGEVREPADPEEVRKMVQNAITILRFALAGSDAAFLLQDVTLDVRDNYVIVSKSFEKEPLVRFTMQQSTTAKEAAGATPPPGPSKRPRN